MRSAKFVLATILVGTAAGVLWATPAQAEMGPICAGAGVHGTVTGDRVVGPVCTPYGGSVLCTWQRAGLDPTLLVEVTACVPW